MVKMLLREQIRYLISSVFSILSDFFSVPLTTYPGSYSYFLLFSELLSVPVNLISISFGSPSLYALSFYLLTYHLHIYVLSFSANSFSLYLYTYFFFFSFYFSFLLSRIMVAVTLVGDNKVKAVPQGDFQASLISQEDFHHLTHKHSGEWGVRIWVKISKREN